MSRISISAMPSSATTNYWRPKDSGSNLVVMLSNLDDSHPDKNVPSTNSMCRGFTTSKFGAPAPFNYSYVYLGPKQGDPKDTLFPDSKLSFLAICYVGVKEEDNWNVCQWQITSSALYKQLITLEASNGITGKMIGIQKNGNTWSAFTAARYKIDEAIVSTLMDQVPPLDEILSYMNCFDTADEIWDYLIRSSKGLASTRDELIQLFGVSSGTSAVLL